MFKIGDKVICVHATLEYPERIIKGTLRVGSIYTVRSLYESDSIRVEEVLMSMNKDKEFSLYNWRFQKLWDDKMLNKNRTKVDKKITEGVYWND